LKANFVKVDIVRRFASIGDANVRGDKTTAEPAWNQVAILHTCPTFIPRIIRAYVTNYEFLRAIRQVDSGSPIGFGLQAQRNAMPGYDGGPWRIRGDDHFDPKPQAAGEKIQRLDQIRTRQHDLCGMNVGAQFGLVIFDHLKTS
jgi:hypothetical protein